MSLQEYIQKGKRLYRGVEYLFYDNNSKTTICFFAGALDKYICVSWFIDNTDYNLLYLKDPSYKSYSNNIYNEVLSFHCFQQEFVIYYGMSMGAIGTLVVHPQSHPNIIIMADPEPRGFDISKLDYFIEKKDGFNTDIILLISANMQDLELSKYVSNLLFNRCRSITIVFGSDEIHLGNILNKQGLGDILNVKHLSNMINSLDSAWKKNSPVIS